MTIALELQQLKKTYPGGVQALRGIDLQVEAGDFRFSALLTAIVKSEPFRWTKSEGETP